MSILSSQELAEVVGQSRQSIENKIKKNNIQSQGTNPKKYNSVEVLPLIFSDGETVSDQKKRAEIATINFKLEKLKGNFIALDDHKILVAEIFADVRQFLEQLKEEFPKLAQLIENYINEYCQSKKGI